MKIDETKNYIKRPELLAPAGREEVFYAVIEAGADAVELPRVVVIVALLLPNVPLCFQAVNFFLRKSTYQNIHH